MRAKSRIQAPLPPASAAVHRRMRQEKPLTRYLAVCLLAGVGVAGASFPQTDPAARFAETLDVELVNVEVMATDGSGRPVYDLLKDDFEILEDGKPVVITHFRPPAPADKRAEPRRSRLEGLPVSERSGARIVVFVDNLNTGPARRSEVFRQLHEALNQHLEPTDEVMVAGFDGGIDVRLPFTTNHKQVFKVLQTMEAPPALQVAAKLEDERMLELMTQSVQSDATCVAIAPLPPAHAQQVHRRVLGTIDALTQLIDSLAGVPGRKALLHVSDGIPLIAGAEVYQHAIELCDGTLGAEGITGGTDTAQLPEGLRIQRFDPMAARTDMLNFDTTLQWQHLTAVANTQQVTIYPLLASGLSTLRRSSATASHRTTLGTETTHLGNEKNTLALMAEETGGVALLDRNDFRDGLEQIIADQHTAYALAYTPPTPGAAQQHSIRVMVKRPGIRLRYGKRYRFKTRDDRLIERLMSSLFHGFGDNPIGAQLTLRTGTQDESNQAAIHIWVGVPLRGLTLLPEGDLQRGLFTVFVVALQPNGRTTEIRHKTFQTEVPSGQSPAGATEYDFVVALDGAPGEHHVAIALRDELGDTTSFVQQSLDVADRRAR